MGYQRSTCCSLDLLALHLQHQQRRHPQFGRTSFQWISIFQLVCIKSFFLRHLRHLIQCIRAILGDRIRKMVGKRKPLLSWHLLHLLLQGFEHAIRLVPCEHCDDVCGDGGICVMQEKIHFEQMLMDLNQFGVFCNQSLESH